VQETVEQCNARRGDLSDEGQPKPLCSAFERPDKNNHNMTAQKLISVEGTT